MNENTFEEKNKEEKTEFVHDAEWHKEHKRLGFFDPIADLLEALEEMEE